MTERAIRTLQQLEAELSGLATDLDSARLARASMAVRDVLRELDPADPSTGDVVRVTIPIWVSSTGVYVTRMPLAGVWHRRLLTAEVARPDNEAAVAARVQDPSPS